MRSYAAVVTVAPMSPNHGDSFIQRPSLRSDVFAHVPEYLGCRTEDLWDAWHFAQAEVEIAFRDWDSGHASSDEGFAVYRAALDREQQACAVVAEALRPRRPSRGRRRL